MVQELDDFKRKYERKCKELAVEVLSTVMLLDASTAGGRLSLSHQALGEKAACALAAGLQGDIYFKEVEIMDAYIGDNGVQAVCEALQNHHSLTSLTLRGNNIRTEGAMAIARLLQTNRSLTHISLEWNNIGTTDAGIASIAHALRANRTLKVLDLRNNKITGEGARALAQMIRVNKALEEVDLRWNKIGGVGGRALNDALQENPTLKELQLSGNEIEFAVVQSLESSLKSSRKRDSLESSRMSQMTSQTGVQTMSFGVPQATTTPSPIQVQFASGSQTAGVTSPSPSKDTGVYGLQRYNEDKLKRREKEMQQQLKSREDELGVSRKECEVLQQQLQKLQREKLSFSIQQESLHNQLASQSSCQEDLEAALSNFKNTEVSFRNKERNYEERIRDLRAEIESLQNMIKNCDGDKQMLEAVVKSREVLEADVRKNKEQTQAANVRAEQAEATIHTTVLRAELAEKDKSRLQEELTSMQERVSRLEHEKLAAEQAHSATGFELSTSERKVKNLLEEVEAYKTRGSYKKIQEMEALRAESDLERKRIEAEHAVELDNRDRKMRAEVDKHRDSEDRLKERIREFEMQESKWKAMAESATSEAESLRQDVETLKKKWQHAKSETQTQIEKLDRSEETVREHKKTISNFQHNILALEEEVARNRAQIELSEKQIGNLEDQVDVEKKVASKFEASIKDTKIEHEKEILRLKAAFNKEKQEITELFEIRVKEKEDVIKSKQQQMDLMREEKESNAIHYQGMIRDVEEQRLRAHEQNTKLDMELSKLQNVISEKTAEITRLEFIQDEGRKVKASLQEQMTLMKEQHQTKLESLCKQYNESKADLDLKLNQKSEKIITLENEVRSLTDRHRLMKDNAQRQHERLQSRLMETMKAVFEDRTHYEPTSYSAL